MKKLKFKRPSDEMLKRDAEIFHQVEFSGVLPSPEDARDFVARSVNIFNLPDEYLAPDTEILNQSSIGSCVAHACAQAMSHYEQSNAGNHNDYSRGYIYGNRRETDHQDEGMITREALKNLNHCGDVLYDDFPYNKKYPEVKKLIAENSEELAKLAAEHKIIEYFRCYDEFQIKDAIMNNGGVIVCVPVYSDFGRDLHKTKTDKLTGHHAMLIVGWTKDNKWIVQNSWGALWGYEGKLLMDFDYPANEYWAISIETDNIKPKKKNIFKKIFNYTISLLQKIFSKKIR